MRDKWDKMTPWTRRIIVLCLTAVVMTLIICATVSDSMVNLYDLILKVIE